MEARAQASFEPWQTSNGNPSKAVGQAKADLGLSQAGVQLDVPDASAKSKEGPPYKRPRGAAPTGADGQRKHWCSESGMWLP